jgi:hypothetical protein
MKQKYVPTLLERGINSGQKWSQPLLPQQISSSQWDSWNAVESLIFFSFDQKEQGGGCEEFLTFHWGDNAIRDTSLRSR